MAKLLFLDVESTGNGTNPNHNIIQMGASLWIDKMHIDRFHLEMAPSDEVVYQIVGGGYKACYDKAQAAKNKRALSQQTGFSLFTSWLEKYIDRYDPKDKLIALAYNAEHEQNMMKLFFNQNEQGRYLPSFFAMPFVCIKGFSNVVMYDELIYSKTRSLADVARHLGISVDRNLLHDPSYDVKIAEKTYWKLYHHFRISTTV